MTTPIEKLIFLMEDEEDIARLIVHILEENGFRVHRPDRSSSLIRAAEEHQPAVFILDLMLPEVDGFQLCRNIREHKSLKSIPILILTARTGAADRERALDSGADVYMTKPFKSSELVAAVRMLHQRSISQ
jgi:two-component system, OmpR family, phosphate regulon response regulator PhoB